MTAPHGEQIVAGYLAQLELALAGVSAGRRADILAEVGDHIAQARAQSADESDSTVYNILDRLGDPTEIAASARSDAPVDGRAGQGAAAAGSWTDIAAVVLTPILWPVGVILLWMSSSWTTRDKLIGTLVPPGGYFGTLLGMSVLAYLGHFAAGACGSGGVDSTDSVTVTCTGLMALPGVVQFFVYAAELLVFVLWLVVPVLTGIYLGVRLRRRMRPARGGAATLVAMHSR